MGFAMILRTLLLLILLSSLAVGCARVELRYAMGRVQRARQALDDRIEAKRTDEIADAIAELSSALRDRRVTESHLFREQPRFRELHAEALEALEPLRARASRGHAADLDDLTGTISLACYNCHEEFKSR